MTDVSHDRTGAIDPLLQIEGLVKRFTGTVALDGVDFMLRAGEIHALLGQNGAGKSTLIKILAGIYRPDAGTIRFAGRQVDPRAEDLPIAFIHQDLGLVETMSVAENFALGASYPTRRGLIDWREARRRAQAALDELDGSIDATTVVAELTQAERALVAIARALSVDARVVVLDEPTASLPADDVARLFSSLGRLRGAGTGVIYVTHRLDEVFELADGVTVLRDGRAVRAGRMTAVTPTDLVFDIVGRAPGEAFARPAPSQEVAARVDDLLAPGLRPLSFTLARGEILALVGLRGSGHDRVGRALFGLDDAARGRLTLLGCDVGWPVSPREAMRNGMGFLSSRRAEEAMAPTLTVRENLYLNPVAAGGSPWVLRPRVEHSAAGQRIAELGVQPHDPEAVISTLSGGNQQKVVLGRWLTEGAHLLVLEEPTTGVDVGAKVEIYTLINALLRRGGAVVLVSSDFDEVAAVAHRALVFNRGRVCAEFAGAALTVEALTGQATGALGEVAA